jgi:heme/copper-type cytochrome/quinol oxidase subunit 2
MAAQRYHHRPDRKPWGPHPVLELVVTAVVLIAVVAVLIVFLFVYHDFPLRVL